jgi:hypothetical protein
MQISKTAIGLIVAAGVTAGAGGALITSRTDTGSPHTARRAGPADTPVATQGVLRDAGAGAVERQPAVVPPASGTAAAPRIRPQAAPEAPPAAATAPPTPTTNEGPAVAPREPGAVAEPLRAPDPVTEPEPAGPELIELVVAADSVIGLQLDSTITSERAQVEDVLEARVVRDVRVGDRVAIPAGSRVSGIVTLVERGGRLKERARLGVRFTSITLPGGVRLPLQTETVYREGDSQLAGSSAKIAGGAIGGAILGGILGGAKGSAIGSGVGAGAGTAVVMAGSRNQATLAAGSAVTVRVEQPVVVTTER